MQGGFWKPDTICELYPTTIQDLFLADTNSVGITFTVVGGRTYRFLYIEQAAGGLLAGLSAWTNAAVAPFVAQGGIGGVTTVFHTVTSSAIFYRVTCE